MPEHPISDAEVGTSILVRPSPSWNASTRHLAGDADQVRQQRHQRHRQRGLAGAGGQN